MRRHAALRPFVRRGLRPGHVLWAGPLFWPYAYGDVFYSSLWPEAYDGPLPGYEDIATAVFAPAGYDGSTRGRARGRGYDDATRTALAERVSAVCEEEANEVAAWPIDLIDEVVKPNETQRAALDALATATAKAGEIVKAGCPTTASFTPSGRLDAMEKRVEALIRAVEVVQQPLQSFYDALDDDQKARFNAIGEADAADEKARAQSRCDGAAVALAPTANIVRALRPNEAQRAKLDEMQAQGARAANAVKAACPAEPPATPPGRLAAALKRLGAMREAIQIVRPAVEAFYVSLDDEQKARFNALGRSDRSRG